MNLLREAIEHGSVFNVLKSETVTAKNILEAILEFQTLDDHRLTQAYRAACTLLHPNEHYINDIHFLAKVQDCSDYGAIFLASEGNIELPVNREAKYSDKIVTVITRSVMKFHTDGSFRRRIMIACGRDPQQHDSGITSCYQLDDIQLAICFRSPLVKTFMVASTFRDENIGKVVVENDAFEYFDAQRSTIMLGQLIARCTYLKGKTSAYWEKVAPDYKRYIEKRLGGSSRSLSRTSLRELHGVFPTLVDERLLTFSELAFLIYFMDPLHRAYVLGYPIQYGLPLEIEIMQALNRLSELGIEKYIAELVEYNRERLKLRLPGVFNTTALEPEKDTDVMEMCVYEYNPFDTIAYNDNGHYYIFTRPEFASLLKSKKHLYTQTILPANIVLDIQQRMKFATEMRLPEPRTVTDFLSQIEEKTLKTEQPSNEAPRPIRTTRTRRHVGNEDPQGLPTFPIGGILLPQPPTRLSSFTVPEELVEHLLNHFMAGQPNLE